MISERASSVPFSLDRYLLDTLRHAQAILPLDSGGLVLYDAATDLLTPHAYLGDGTHVVPRIALGQGIVGRVGQGRKPERVENMRADPRCTFVDPLSRSELAVPLVFGDELIGVFNVESHRPGAYTAQDQATLQVLADQIALVIYTLRRYRGLAASHNELLEGVQARRREAEALQRLATITSATLDLDEMLANALRETAELLDCEGAQLLMPDHVAYRLVVHEPSLYGLAQSWPIASWPLDGPGHVVDVYHTGEPHLFHVSPPEAGPGARSLLACPLNTRNRTLGVLQLINQRAGTFTPAQVDLAQTVARQIAVSLGSAQQFVAERRRAELLNRINHVSQELYATLDPETLLHKAAQRIHEVFARQAVHIFLLTPDGQSVQVGASVASAPPLRLPDDFTLPITKGIAGRAIRSGQAQIVADLRDDPDYVLLDEGRRLQSCLVVPLRRTDESIGAIALFATDLNAFGDLERDALETLATQLVIALENAQLYYEVQRRLREQTVVHQIGQDLTAILDYRELSEALVQHMNRALNTSACVVGLYEPDHSTVKVEADYRAPHHHHVNGPLMTGQSLRMNDVYALAQAIITRQPVTVYADDPQAHPDARALLERLGDHSQLIVPMVAGEQVVGMVGWLDDRPGRRFSLDDIQLARTLVAQATIAVDNALLFRQLEVRAQELAEANRLRSQFLATVSHELRTPMNSIIGFSETLLEGLYGELNERQAGRLERIRDNAYSLLALINDLLDLSKIDAGHMSIKSEVVSVSEALTTAAQTLEPQATAKGLSLSLDIPDDLPYVRADPERVHQVIVNLLSNAIKFTHDGAISVTACRSEQNGRPVVEASVIDTGIGISEADQMIIFDEFRQVDGSSTRAYGGTGLGLAITKKLVEMMGGAVWVESELGQGSKFTFALPTAREKD
jgi:signal transduction histidine kinase/putative methionine-R-sulfoxide reductase with GAF domain